MTALFRRIQPAKTFRITVDTIAQFLGIPASLIVRVQCWRYVLFVHRLDRGGQFVSYRKLQEWKEAIALIIESCITFKELWQLWLQVKQDCQKFQKQYKRAVIAFLRQLWLKRRDALKSLPQVECAAE